MFRLPQNAAFSTPPKRQSLYLESGRGLANVVNPREKHEQRPRKRLLPIKRPCDDCLSGTRHPTVPQPRCHPGGICHMDVERQPALPHPIVRLPPERTRLIRERRIKLCIHCHADSLRGTSQSPFGDLVHTLAQARDINKAIRQAESHMPIRDKGSVAAEISLFSHWRQRLAFIQTRQHFTQRGIAKAPADAAM